MRSFASALSHAPKGTNAFLFAVLVRLSRRKRFDGQVAVAYVVAYAVGRGTLKDSPGVNHAALRAKGFDDDSLAKIEKALAAAFEIKFAFNKWTLGEDFCKTRLGLTQTQLEGKDEHVVFALPRQLTNAA